MARSLRQRLAAVLLVLTASFAGLNAGAAEPAWRALDAGLHYAELDLGMQDGEPLKLHVVRADPGQVELFVGLASARDGKRRSAKEWCGRYGLAVAINLGMYQQDYLTHVGHLRHGEHVNSAGYVRRYQSMLTLGADEGGRAYARLLDWPEEKPQAAGAYTLVQNLRLIKGRGLNVWSPGNEERHAIAALATDREGRLLFLFVARPLAIYEFNRLLLKAPLGVWRAQYLEGGREASLSVHAGGVELDLAGHDALSLAAGIAAPAQSLLPNILGVVRLGRHEDAR